MSLANKAKQGLIWSALERFGLNGLVFFKGIVLARLLVPEEFGLLAMVTVFTVIASGVTDFGFSQSVIQKKDLSHADRCTAFYINILIGALMTCLLYLGAPFVADFYRDSRLILILRCVSVSVFIGALGQVHRAQLIRELKFRQTALVSCPATILSVAVVVMLALMDWGVWALVIGSVVEKSTTTLLLWYVSEWRPTLLFSRRSMRDMLPFGSKLAAGAILRNVFDNIYVLIIGRYFPPIDVGYYQRAQSFNRMGSQSLSSVIGRVAFPLLSKIQDEREKMGEFLLRWESILTLIFFPAMALMAGAAEPVIVLIVGEKWLPAVPYLQILALSGALYPMSTMMVNAMKACGRSGLMLNIALLRHGLTIITIALTIQYGVIYMLIGKVVGDVILVFVRVFFLSRLFPIGLAEQLGKIAYALPLALVVFLAVLKTSDTLAAYSCVLALISAIAVTVAICALYVFILRKFMQNELRTVASHSSIAGRIYFWLYGERAQLS
jgi:O-antigen/teichoic acid export membrane protein